MYSKTLQTALLACALVAGPAAAQVVTEAGDAGESLATAQVTSGYVTVINGVLGSATDTDLYRISITNPAAFSVSVVSNMSFPDDEWPTHPDDTALFLFDGAGIVVGFSDDHFDGTTYTYTPQFNVGEFAGLAAGDYYLGFNNFFRRPTIDDGPFYLPGIGEGPITGWTGEPNVPRIGAYTLTLTGVGSRTEAEIDLPPGGVPEPGTWALMILGFGGAGAMLRRRRESLA